MLTLDIVAKIKNLSQIQDNFNKIAARAGKISENFIPSKEVAAFGRSATKVMESLGEASKLMMKSGLSGAAELSEEITDLISAISSGDAAGFARLNLRMTDILSKTVGLADEFDKLGQSNAEFSFSLDEVINKIKEAGAEISKIPEEMSRWAKFLENKWVKVIINVASFSWAILSPVIVGIGSLILETLAKVTTFIFNKVIKTFTKLFVFIKDGFISVGKTIGKVIISPLILAHKAVTLIGGTLKNWILPIFSIATLIQLFKSGILEVAQLQSELGKQAVMYSNSIGSAVSLTKQWVSTANNLRANVPTATLSELTSIMAKFGQEGITSNKIIGPLTGSIAKFGFFVGDAAMHMIPFLSDLEKSGQLADKSDKKFGTLNKVMGAIVIGFGDLAPAITESVLRFSRLNGINPDGILKISRSAAAMARSLRQVGFNSKEASEFMTSLLQTSVRKLPAAFQHLFQEIKKGDFSGVIDQLDIIAMQAASAVDLGFVSELASATGISEEFIEKLGQGKITVAELAKIMEKESKAAERYAGLNELYATARSGLFSQIGDSFTILKVLVTEAGTVFFDTFTKMFQGGTNVKVTVEDLTRKLKGPLTTAAKFLGESLAILVDLFSTLGETAEKYFGTFAESSGLTAALAERNAGLTDKLTVLGFIMEKVKKGFNEFIEGFKDGGEATKAFTNTTGTVGMTLKGLSKEIGTYLKEIDWKEVGKFARDLFISLVQVFDGIASAGKKLFKGLMEGFGVKIDEAEVGGGIIGILGEFAVWLDGPGGDAIGRFGESLAKLIGKLFEEDEKGETAFGGTLDALGTLGTVFINVMDMIRSPIDSLQGALDKLFLGVALWLGTMPINFFNTMKSMFTKTGEFLTKKFPMISKLFGGMFSTEAIETATTIAGKSGKVAGVAAKAARFLPGVGTAIQLGLGTKDFAEGDYIGGTLKTAAGAAGVIPIAGTAVQAALTATDIVYELLKDRLTQQTEVLEVISENTGTTAVGVAAGNIRERGNRNRANVQNAENN